MSQNIAIKADQDSPNAFGDFTAVDGISFEVQKGEIFGFLGANGAGKTTAMRMLCGLVHPHRWQRLPWQALMYTNKRNRSKGISAT